MDRLFFFWDYSCRGALSLQVRAISRGSHKTFTPGGMQDLVTGLDGIVFGDLMDNIEWFFNLHDKNKDGFLTKDEVLTVSESLLVC
jgi:TBC1 domain family member 8/9